MTSRPEVEVYPDAEQAAVAAATAIADWLAAGLDENGRASFVGTGGSSPGPVYDLLATLPLPWEQISVTLSDERWVPPTSPDSNERQLRERLLVGEAAGAAFVPLWSDAPAAEEAAEAAELAVADLFPADVVLLGMGEDGHFASLFPGNPALEEGLDPLGGSFVIAVPAGEPAPAMERLSLTLYALKQAFLTIVLIRGEAKRRIIEDRDDLPIHALFRAADMPVRVIWSP
ncbi:MAG: 6-phosphogluconolactonase [Caulobacterales bacterium]|nr:6-phosphogluconolactonase [Caulobacterales bacterium]